MATPPPATIEENLGSFMVAIVVNCIKYTNLIPLGTYTPIEVAAAVNKVNNSKDADLVVNGVLLTHSAVIFKATFTSLMWNTKRDQTSSHDVPGFNNLEGRQSVTLTLPAFEKQWFNPSHTAALKTSIKMTRVSMNNRHETLTLAYPTSSLSEVTSVIGGEMGRDAEAFLELLIYKAEMAKEKKFLEYLDNKAAEEKNSISDSSSSSSSDSVTTTCSSVAITPAYEDGHGLEATSDSSLLDAVAVERVVQKLRSEMEDLKKALGAKYGKSKAIMSTNEEALNASMQFRDVLLRDVELVPTWFSIFMPLAFAKRDLRDMEAKKNQMLIRRICDGESIVKSHIYNKLNTKEKEKLAQKINNRQLWADMMLAFLVFGSSTHQTTHEWLKELTMIAISNNMSKQGIDILNKMHIVYSKETALDFKDTGVEEYYKETMKELAIKLNETETDSLTDSTKRKHVAFLTNDNYAKIRWQAEMREGTTFTKTIDSLTQMVFLLPWDTREKLTLNAPCSTRMDLQEIANVEEIFLTRTFDIGDVLSFPVTGAPGEIAEEELGEEQSTLRAPERIPIKDRNFYHQE